MTVRFYITPYDPATWKDKESQHPSSSLMINLQEFIQAASQNKWKNVSKYFPSSWSILIRDNHEIAGSFGGEKNQILSVELGDGLNEFVLWYRGYIPSEFDLYLFREGSWESLKLTQETTLQNIAEFVGL
jgi:hypothetical protein